MATGGGTAAGAAAAPPGPVKVAIQPRRFSGEAHECSKEFLDLFEEAALCNRWTPDVCALQFPNYLYQTAGKWWRAFKNDRIRAAAGAAVVPPTWTQIKTAFQSAFASVGDLVNAELKLDSRKQRMDESVEQYIYEILHLCDTVDPNMSEERRVRFLLRNMREWYLTKVMPLNPTSVDEIHTHMRRLAEMKRMTEKYQERELPILSVVQESAATLEMKEMVKQTQKLVEEIQLERRQEKEEREREQNRRRQEMRASTRCYNCNMVGHMARNCRNSNILNQGRRPDFGNAMQDQRRVHFGQERGRNRSGEGYNITARPMSQERRYESPAQQGNLNAGAMAQTSATGRANVSQRW